jgi:hypothetical protein
VWWSWSPGPNPDNVGIEVTVDHMVDDWYESPYWNCIGSHCTEHREWKKSTVRKTFKAKLDPRKNYCYTVSPGYLEDKEC